MSLPSSSAFEARLHLSVSLQDLVQPLEPGLQNLTNLVSHLGPALRG